jgi:hypothetical protein
VVCSSQQYINQVAQKKSYITIDELYDYCSQLYNYIDKAILALLFEGVKGRSDIDHSFEELRNLKMTDIFPENNAIIATRDPDKEHLSKTTRVISVDPRTMDILVAACKEDAYHKSNGEAKGKFAIMPIKNTPYLIRTIEKLASADDGRIAVGNISSRFKNFRKYTGIKYLTPTLIFQSGMLYRLLKTEEEIGEELKPEDFRQAFRNLELDERNWSSLKEMYESYKQNKSIVLE